CAPAAHELLELRELAARQLAVDAEVAHRRRVGEDAELRVAREGGRVLDLETEAQVGLVGAVPPVGVLPLHARERRLELDPAALLPDAGDDPLDESEQRVDVWERHLDVELRELLQPVGAQILVSEAAGDLVVALEARDDEQLLVDLRALRQREEAAGLQAG